MYVRMRTEETTVLNSNPYICTHVVSGYVECLFIKNGSKIGPLYLVIRKYTQKYFKFLATYKPNHVF